MKTLKFFVLFLITVIIGLITLLVMAIYHTNYRIEDSIVFIESIGDNVIESGMGFVYSEDGTSDYIVTNYHVVNTGKEINVYNLHNKKEQASLIYFDSYTDIAILQISDELNLKQVKFPNEDAKVNDKMYYFDINKNNIQIGSIISFNNEITINADYGYSYYKAVSINANIENGNSGCPVFNKDKEFIGMISLKDEEFNESYYIDYDIIRDIVTKLENHTLVRPNIGGIFASSNNLDILNEFEVSLPNIAGVVILNVFENSALDVNGFIKGDIITKINDKTIKDVSDFQMVIYSYNIGDEITIEYYRNDNLNKSKIILK